MRAKSGSFVGFLAVAMVATLLPAAAAAAELVPGRPGRYELSSITIDATSGDCKATYQAPAAGNLWMRGVDANVRVLANPTWVHATCRFTDMSARIELNAEVGHTDACELVTDTATYTDGWGIAVSAANISERAEGGNSVVMCRFRLEPAAAVARSPVAATATPATGSGGAVTTRQRGRSSTAADERASGTAGYARPADRSATGQASSPKTRELTTSRRTVANERKTTRADGRPKPGSRAGKPGRGTR